MAAQPKTTVDEKELNHFNSLVAEWRSKLQILVAMNEIRLPFIQEGLLNTGKLSGNTFESAKPLSGMKILDVGCGIGILSEPLVQAGAVVTGLDAAADVIKGAQLNAHDNEEFKTNLNYVCDTIENFCDTHVEQFDVVVASEIVEHVTSVDLFLKCCIKTLKPGGSIYITTINRTIWSWLKAIIFYEYITGTIPAGSHEWNKFVSPDELRDILDQYKCQVRVVRGWQYNVYHKKWNKTDDLSVFYLLHAVKEEK